jgi:diguanylate cyclase (GGDEF)-like protein
VALLTLLTAVAVAVIGGSQGFWLSLPFALLAATMAQTTAGSLAAAATLQLTSAIVVAARGATLPTPLLMLLVPLGCVLVLDRVSRRLQSDRDALALAAFSDPLTGLANRRRLMAMAEYEIARHRRADARFVTVMIDLDGFKLLNDRYGHAAGDQMLCDVADALTRALRSQDTVARLGGDEFCVIAPETENPRGLAQKIVLSVEEATRGRAPLGASVGVAVYPDDGTNTATLLEVADSRLIAAKRRLYAASSRRAA